MTSLERLTRDGTLKENSTDVLIVSTILSPVPTAEIEKFFPSRVIPGGA